MTSHHNLCHTFTCRCRISSPQTLLNHTAEEPNRQSAASSKNLQTLRLKQTVQENCPAAAGGWTTLASCPLLAQD